MDHTLAITEVVVQLLEASLPELDVVPEPDCWRQFQLGTNTPDILKPDLEVVVGGEDYQDHWFIEIDLDTESRPAIRRKCKTYLDHFRTGIEQKRTGVHPKVLWITPDEQRRVVIAGVIKDLHERVVADRLFETTTAGTALSVIVEGGNS